MEESLLNDFRFKIGNSELREIIESKDPAEEIRKLEGVAAITTKLCSNIETGLSESNEELLARQSK